MHRPCIRIIFSSIYIFAARDHLKNLKFVQGSACRLSFIVHVIAVVAGYYARPINAILRLYHVNYFACGKNGAGSTSRESIFHHFNDGQI